MKSSLTCNSCFFGQTTHSCLCNRRFWSPIVETVLVAMPSEGIEMAKEIRELNRLVFELLQFHIVELGSSIWWEDEHCYQQGNA